MSMDAPSLRDDTFSKSQPEWTYLVNLDVTMWDSKHNQVLGSTQRFEQLKELVNQTKDGKSQLIVPVVDGKWTNQ